LGENNIRKTDLKQTAFLDNIMFNKDNYPGFNQGKKLCGTGKGGLS
jgi:hypothetical protein